MYIWKRRRKRFDVVAISEERLIQAARGCKIYTLEAASVLKRSKKKKRLEDWEEKVLHGQYLRQTKK